VPEWSAEVAVDEDLVRRLLGEQFGELALRSVRLLGEGWDNAVWLVDERWIFRFPRRRIAVPGVERAIALLPASPRSCRSRSRPLSSSAGPRTASRGRSTARRSCPGARSRMPRSTTTLG
jgi:hypothetical protein